ncbi:hypothetical protein F7725_013630 [Dissostichus mawsoni]|uniref:Activating molecule in BECN1-regulated autophagy protein 1 n=1 Tax=Dissostichus mawsoni TaxID=36200 RepID=A0A7J5YTM5_DISMA|nr:hypothetical protein F7725_013630 [Dissostichus mawsoni]
MCSRERGSQSLSSQRLLQLVVEEKVRWMKWQSQKVGAAGQPPLTFLLAFSPDKDSHGLHACEPNIYITEVKTGKCLHSLVGHRRTPWCVTFHPTIPGLGGSESWFTESNVAIASLAFHPTAQLLLIATNNELHFWDWSRPEPFAVVKTGSDTERVRLVRFDPLGHNLLTAIVNPSNQQSEEDSEVPMDSVEMPHFRQRSFLPSQPVRRTPILHNFLHILSSRPPPGDQPRPLGDAITNSSVAETPSMPLFSERPPPPTGCTQHLGLMCLCSRCSINRPPPPEAPPPSSFSSAQPPSEAPPPASAFPIAPTPGPSAEQTVGWSTTRTRLSGEGVPAAGRQQGAPPEALSQEMPVDPPDEDSLRRRDSIRQRSLRYQQNRLRAMSSSDSPNPPAPWTAALTPERELGTGLLETPGCRRRLWVASRFLLPEYLPYAGSSTREDSPAWPHTPLSTECSLARRSDGQSAVASNIANTTYRLQWWGLHQIRPAGDQQRCWPSLFPAASGVSLTKESSPSTLWLLTTWEDALHQEIRSQRHLRVPVPDGLLCDGGPGLPQDPAAPHHHMVAQMVFNVVYPMAPDQRRHVSINSARWLPDPGMGLAYGTNKGDLVICRPVFYRSDGESPAESSSEPLFSVNNSGTSRTRGTERPGPHRSGWRLDRDMGLMNAIDSSDSPGEDALARIRRLIAEGGMTAVVQREQSTTMASMGGFGNNIIRLPDRGQQGLSGQSLSGTSATGQSLTGTSATGQSLNGQSLTSTSLVDIDDVFEGGRTNEDSLPGPSSSSSSSSSSMLLSSPPPSSSSSHSGGGGASSGYPGDPYSSNRATAASRELLKALLSPPILNSEWHREVKPRPMWRTTMELSGLIDEEKSNLLFGLTMDQRWGGGASDPAPQTNDESETGGGASGL